ncbi:MAG: LysM peptidoglycan-binding domain-containing M23 family metallopeptidase [bacterium]|nr:LysM peptidoglycan-binding domain-containing M23 family metallopeptidase [bacterium]
MRHNIVILIIMLIFMFTGAGFANNSATTLKSLKTTGNKALKSLRGDIRTAIRTIRSNRPPEKLPDLKFYKYRVKKGENFWKILARSSLDMDTLISLNSISSPRDIQPGTIIYFPNMRGIIINGTDKKKIRNILRKNRVKSKYIYRVNKCADFNKPYLFLPCVKLTSLERSLFLGTGFIYPLKKGKRTSGFGSRRNPFNKKKFQFHTGIDIACAKKTKVFAARAGKVIFSGYKGGYGRLVILQHEHGYRSYYGHLSRSLVRKGRVVKTGERIALSGNTGRTTGPHLHFEIRRGGRAINPGVMLRR